MEFDLFSDLPQPIYQNPIARGFTKRMKYSMQFGFVKLLISHKSCSCRKIWKRCGKQHTFDAINQTTPN